jgi:hypothetical protein
LSFAGHGSHDRPRQGRDRREAASPKSSQHGTFGKDRLMSRQMTDSFDNVDGRAIVKPRFQPESCLSDGWQHFVTGKALRNAMIQTKPLQTCGRQKNGIVLTIIELFQPGIQVAPNIQDLDVWS